MDCHLSCMICYDECREQPVLPCKTCTAMLCATCANAWASFDADDDNGGGNLKCPQCRALCTPANVLPFLDAYRSTNPVCNLSGAELVRDMLSARDIAFLPAGVVGTLGDCSNVLFLRGKRNVPLQLCSMVSAAIAECGAPGALFVACEFGALHPMDVDPLPAARVYAIHGEGDVRRVRGLDGALANHVDMICHAKGNYKAPACVGDFLVQCRQRTLPSNMQNSASLPSEVAEREKTNRLRLRLSVAESVVQQMGTPSSFDINRLRWMFQTDE